MEIIIERYVEVWRGMERYIERDKLVERGRERYREGYIDLEVINSLTLLARR